MEEYKFLLDIAIILAMTKAFSLVSKKFNMPPVVGALIAGIILGPVVLNIVDPSDSILNLAEVGVVVLMFQAGLETDIDELKKSGIPAFVIEATLFIWSPKRIISISCESAQPAQTRIQTAILCKVSSSFQ